MREILLLAALCVSCGADDEKAPEGAVAESSKPEVGPELAGGVLAVRDEPVCEMSRNGQVIYLLTSKKFKTCDATTGTWYEIDVKGDKGDAGKQGEKGEAGAKGDKGDTGATGPQGVAGVAGSTGSAGPAGAAGQDGQSASDNMWYDAAIDKWWVIGWTAVYSEAKASCETGGRYRLPTWAELRGARQRGLCKVDTRCNTNPSNAWYESTTYDVLNMFADATSTLTASQSAIVYCIER